MFKIYDNKKNSYVRNPESYFLSGDGKLFTKCDPYGINASKLEITEINRDRFKVRHIERKDY